MLWIPILIGILLRMTDLNVPDLATDEAQFALGASAAHPPLGMWLMQLSQTIVGHTLVGVRITSVLAGIAVLPLLWLLARRTLTQRGALLALTVASLFPAAIFFSRLGYLSALQCVAWIATTVLFLRAQEKRSTGRLLGLYLMSLATTFIKTQSMLLPVLLLLGRVIERRGRVMRDPLTWILALSVLPILVYIPLHPQIVATLLQNTGSTYGVHSPLSRFIELLQASWYILGPTALLIVCAIPWLRRFPWPVWSVCLLTIVQQFLLGPGHQYYATEWIIWALPIAAFLLALPRSIRAAFIVAQLIVTLALLLPSFFATDPWRQSLFQETGYWNTHASEINALVKDADRLVVVGDAGHELRFYLSPEILVGNSMNLTTWTGSILTLSPATFSAKGRSILFQDAHVTLLGPSARSPVH